LLALAATAQWEILKATFQWAVAWVVAVEVWVAVAVQVVQAQLVVAHLVLVVQAAQAQWVLARQAQAKAQSINLATWQVSLRMLSHRL
jgi:hypothetical protein